MPNVVVADNIPAPMVKHFIAGFNGQPFTGRPRYEEVYKDIINSYEKVTIDTSLARQIYERGVSQRRKFDAGEFHNNQHTNVIRF